VVKGKMYDYNGKVVLCRQDHLRTEHDPETVPALFSFYREDTGDLDWIVNESVEIGSIRTYNGIKYECIQAHMTLQGWEPDKTPALWKVYQEAPPVGAWSSGVAYKIGDQVTYLGHTYECRQAHTSISTWHPDVVPALWLLII
ncbi:MAG TPA: carbohydrate-binding protein, partial [Bacteroidales bacterium]|nr:carbohydrate-binding protein [Bacteroidales bacterium]